MARRFCVVCSVCWRGVWHNTGQGAMRRVEQQVGLCSMRPDSSGESATKRMAGAEILRGMCWCGVWRGDLPCEIGKDVGDGFGVANHGGGLTDFKFAL